MELLSPSFGLIFWMTICFGLLFFLLKKMAWKPIMKAIHDREHSIDEAIKTAERTKLEMAQLKAANEDLLKAARAERDQLLKEAREARESMIAEAKGKAKQEADRILSSAREQIKNEKMAAITELKNQVATLSIDIAEKILRNELSKDEKQKQLVDGLVNEINMN